MYDFLNCDLKFGHLKLTWFEDTSNKFDASNLGVWDYVWQQLIKGLENDSEIWSSPLSKHLEMVEQKSNKQHPQKIRRQNYFK